jgi:hypothetical protein
MPIPPAEPVVELVVGVNELSNCIPPTVEDFPCPGDPIEDFPCASDPVEEILLPCPNDPAAVEERFVTPWFLEFERLNTGVHFEWDKSANKVVFAIAVVVVEGTAVVEGYFLACATGEVLACWAGGAETSGGEVLRGIVKEGRGGLAWGTGVFEVCPKVRFLPGTGVPVFPVEEKDNPPNAEFKSPRTFEGVTRGVDTGADAVDDNAEVVWGGSGFGA